MIRLVWISLGLCTLPIICYGKNNEGSINEETINENTSSDETINLYLPIPEEKFTKISDEFNSLLKDNGLSTVQLAFSNHWHSYQNGLKDGRKGIYFTAPHFASWAIHRKNFQPLLKLDSVLSYSIVTYRYKSEFFEINDLADKIICTKNPLSLDYLLINTAFENKPSSAKIGNVDSPIKHMLSSKSKCDAFVINEHLVEKIEFRYPNKYIRLFQGDSYNNYVFISHPEIEQDLNNRVVDLLGQNKTLSILSSLFRSYSNNPNLVEASSSDYPEHYHQILEKYWD